MTIMAVGITHMRARQLKKVPFFFSRFNFENMQERGNTHYCFDCGGGTGFTPGEGGVALNSVDSSGYDAMRNHSPTSHANAIIGGAEAFESAAVWLETHVPKNFPYLICIR